VLIAAHIQRRIYPEATAPVILPRRTYVAPPQHHPTGAKLDFEPGVIIPV